MVTHILEPSYMVVPDMRTLDLAWEPSYMVDAGAIDPGHENFVGNKCICIVINHLFPCMLASLLIL